MNAISFQRSFPIVQGTRHPILEEYGGVNNLLNLGRFGAVRFICSPEYTIFKARQQNNTKIHHKCKINFLDFWQSAQWSTALWLCKGGSHVMMVLWKPLVCVGAGIIIFNSPGILGSLAILPIP